MSNSHAARSTFNPIAVRSNQTALSSSSSTCLDSNTPPLQLQNATAWNETGCSRGFYCERSIHHELLAPVF